MYDGFFYRYLPLNRGHGLPAWNIINYDVEKFLKRYCYRTKKHNFQSDVFERLLGKVFCRSCVLLTYTWCLCLWPRGSLVSFVFTPKIKLKAAKRIYYGDQKNHTSAMHRKISFPFFLLLSIIHA